MRQGVLYRWLHRVWYDGGSGGWALLPFSGLYWLVTVVRRALYRAGLLRTVRVPVPVIIVGNLTAGGTGKTPVTAWLATELAARGFRPGIVSRGYGGSRASAPMRVDAASDPAAVGDEPVLLAQRTGLPVCVDPDRVRAAMMLIEEGVDLVIADDGLQHLKLARDYEICVIDGARWLGNGRVLPAGPLRDTTNRLCAVDQVLVNGKRQVACEAATLQNAIEFELVSTDVSRLDGSLVRPIEGFAGTTVHAVAAIGNPGRFFDQLRRHDIQVIEHAFPDHAPLDAAQLSFADEFPVLMTEKDAVKLGSRAGDRFWYVPAELRIVPELAGPWLAQIESRMKAGSVIHD